jgi:hypothetical protein
MQIEIQTLACGMGNLSVGRLSAGVIGKQYHGFLGGLQWIIESHALHDKHSYDGKAQSDQSVPFQSTDGAAAGHTGLDTAF